MHAMLSVPRLTAAVCLPFLWLCACDEGGVPPAFPESRFTLLEVTRSAFVEFCPDEGEVLTAEVRRGADGTVTMQGERAEAGDPQTDACEDAIDFCVIRRAFGPQTLTAAQVAELEDAIAAVERKECTTPDDYVVEDPCLLTTVTVNGTHPVDDYCLGELSRGFTQSFGDLLDLIDTLAPEPAPREFPGSAFTELKLERMNGLGFCIEQGDVLTAEVSRGVDGTVTMQGERVVAGDPQAGTCDLEFEGCLVRQSFGPQTLTEAQVAALQDAIAAVERRECDEYEDIFVDPCLITRVTVDGAGADDYCNGELNSGFKQPFDELAERIDTLAAPPQP